MGRPRERQNGGHHNAVRVVRQDTAKCQAYAFDIPENGSKQALYISMRE